MVKLRRVKLDILKPHHPNAVDFAAGLGEDTPGCTIHVRVVEIDERTETLEVVVEGEEIRFDRLCEAVGALGGSLHSVDEVLVDSTA